MPLARGGKKAVSKNIATEMRAGVPRRQAIAIGINAAKRKKKA